jgi:hypothetical protein
MVTNMKIDIEVGRALLYETSLNVDRDNNNLRVLETGLSKDKEDEKARKQASRVYKRLNAMLTPMSKYYNSEMSIRVANDTIQVLGGSGYMKDYAAERYLRDSRITTIYEGTSQLQVVAAIRGVTSGTLEQWSAPHEAKNYDDPMLAELKQKLIDARREIESVVQTIKPKGNSYLDLAARKLVDGAITIVVGHLFLGQAAANDRKKRIVRRYLQRDLPILKSNLEQILSGDCTPLDEYALIAGPVPAA